MTSAGSMSRAAAKNSAAAAASSAARAASIERVGFADQGTHETLDETLDLALGQRADEAVDRLASLKGDHGRDRLDAELGSDLGMRFDIHFDELELALGGFDELFENRGELPARGGRGSPKIHQDRLARRFRDDIVAKRRSGRVPDETAVLAPPSVRPGRLAPTCPNSRKTCQRPPITWGQKTRTATSREAGRTRAAASGLPIGNGSSEVQKQPARRARRQSKGTIASIVGVFTPAARARSCRTR